jgi:DNA repair protein RadA/Sms
VKPALMIVDSGADGVLAEVSVGARQHRPGARSGDTVPVTAKGHNIPTFLVGHITKTAVLAGPKALEHVVDTVLYFEGERHHSHRIVRAIKNRFGAASELGVFEMTGTGLRPVPNPRRCSSRSVPRRRPDPPCCAVLKARGRCS